MNPFSHALIIPALIFTLPALANEPDGDLESLIRKALLAKTPPEQQACLEHLKAHRFPNSKAKERERALFAQGILEQRLGDPKAASTFRKLERGWPHSTYIDEIQTDLAADALEHRRYKQAETRARKALSSDIPVESKRRAQEVLLGVLAAQNRLAEGVPILRSLHPAGSEKPSERGLAAMVEILCYDQKLDEAESAWKDFHKLYPHSKLAIKTDLAWAKLMGSQGDPKGAAELLQKTIRSKPSAPEADEARLALASLLSEGRLRPSESAGLPSPEKLLEELRRTDRKGASGRQVALIKLRLSLSRSQWKEALDLCRQIRSDRPQGDEAALVQQLRTKAFQGWVQEVLGGGKIDPLLPALDAEGVDSLSRDTRLALVRLLAKTGLPSAAKMVLDNAPSTERPALRAAALEVGSAQAYPQDTLGLLPGRNETPFEQLRRAQSAVAMKRWADARKALLRAKPGPERITALMSYLLRPLANGETPQARRKEAESWLARSPEKGAEREPLTILTADLRAKTGDWRGALALYPTQPAAPNRGWIILMRATCQWKLRQKDAALATLKTGADAQGFKQERTTLQNQLSR